MSPAGKILITNPPTLKFTAASPLQCSKSKHLCHKQSCTVKGDRKKGSLVEANKRT